jgi:hypothetical protein
MESTIKIHTPKTYLWDPKPDITAYELALCLPAAYATTFHHHYYNQLPDEAKRHWKEQSAGG